MLMNRIRHSRKKYRGVLIAVIGLLIVSLVSTFALLGSSAGVDGGNTDSGEQLKLQIRALEGAIAELEAIEEKDYSTNSNLASYYASLSSAYTDLGDAKAPETSLKAATYYHAALETAPEEMNDLGKAQIYSYMAGSYYAGGDAVMADAAFGEALALAPDNWGIARTYSFFLFGTKGIDAAIEYLESFKELASQDGKATDEIQEMIETFKSLQEAFNEAGLEDNEESDDGEASDENSDADKEE